MNADFLTDSPNDSQHILPLTSVIGALLLLCVEKVQDALIIGPCFEQVIVDVEAHSDIGQESRIDADLVDGKY